jgi:hypothetical protein
VIPEPRRAGASFTLSGEGGTVVRTGEAEALIGDETLTIGPVSVSYLDADVLTTADYRIEIELWPSGRLVLTQLGRRFDTFVEELRRARNQARVAGLLAHGITMPEVFTGAVLLRSEQQLAELQVFDTHITIVPLNGDPWQVPLGSVHVVRAQPDPPAVVVDATAGLTTFGQLGRRRDACHVAIVERMEAQRHRLTELTGQAGFSDGWGRGRQDVAGFDEMFARFAAPERAGSGRTLLSMATAEARLGLVQLLDPDPEGLSGEAPLPANLALFLLVPVRDLTVLEIVAGPAAATYVFRGEIDAVNRDLQLMHFRRAPLALTPEQAVPTPENPHRLALRKLQPLQRLRSITTARLIHGGGWEDALRAALSR